MLLGVWKPAHCGLRRRLILAIALFVCFLLLLFNVLPHRCPAGVCLHPVLQSSSVLQHRHAPVEEPVEQEAAGGVSFERIHSADTITFNQSGRDVLVFLHIQKTGGSQFSENLAAFLDLPQPCDCPETTIAPCVCHRPGSERQLWLFSWHSVNWSCGLHPAWTWLVRCVNSRMDQLERERMRRRYFYVTMLRDPVERYMSEMYHVQHALDWGSFNWCEGRPATKEEIRPCLFDLKYPNMTLDDFLQCDSNLANNRETWMLADLRLVHCYNNTSNMTTSQRQHRDQILLQSAKDNLRRMSFFGLTERQREGQWMFERTFGMRFVEPLEQFNHTRARLMLENITLLQLDRIQQRNQLDIQLYRFAQQLFQQRLSEL